MPSRHLPHPAAATSGGPNLRFFWHADAPPNGCLSQWAPAAFEIDGERYPTAEHYMMAAKARLFGDEEARTRILASPDPRAAKALGRGVRGFSSERWAMHREAVVLAANLAKFGQDPQLEAFLLSTAPDTLAEASPHDAIWGIGLAADHPDASDPARWPGRNLLGRTLMKVRDILATRRHLDIDRDLAARLGHEALEVNRRGEYTAPSGRTVSIARALDRARSGTVEYTPDRLWPPPPPRSGRVPAIEVTCETTLAAARRLLDDGLAPTALNFAAATAPGGGFLSGSRAQEEYLVRSSGLHACLDGRAMYAASRGRRDPFYADWVIHSPAVPVFRDDTGVFREEPWTCGILTSPAVHAQGVRRYCPDREGEIEAAMRRRTRCVLAAATAHDCRALVLGAWGCGAFGNDTPTIARLFREELADWAAAFDRVIFAVTDWSAERRFIGPFEREFTRAGT